MECLKRLSPSSKINSIPAVTVFSQFPNICCCCVLLTSFHQLLSWKDFFFFFLCFFFKFSLSFSLLSMSFIKHHGTLFRLRQGQYVNLYIYKKLSHNYLIENDNTLGLGLYHKCHMSAKYQIIPMYLLHHFQVRNILIVTWPKFFWSTH